MSDDNKPQKSTVIDAKKAIFDKIFKENQELRDRNHEFAQTLANFERLAEEREAQHKRFEDLEVTILEADDLVNLASELQNKLSTDFAIPMANISLIEKVKNGIGIEFQELYKAVDENQESKPAPTMTFIKGNDYNRLFPQHLPLVATHPDPVLIALFDSLNKNGQSIESSAFVPLISHGQAIGTLNMASPDPEKFIPGTATDAVENLSRKLAIVIENCLLTAQLQKLLRTDPLTGLFNRRTLDEVLPIEFARAHRYDHPLSLIMIDLDDFKLVNDRYGHPAGDKVLAEIGEIISNNLRQHDIGLRYGGDEFTIILPDTNHRQGQAVISKLTKIAAAAKVNVDQNTSLPIKLSAGLATYPDNPAVDAEALKKVADNDLYKTKNKKKKDTKTKEKK
ncbi:MAG: sensor domain-containing diguanylate cyclase [Deltaproteobacteria bacterium]|nr:sensor domain-containing diguanylate cyclase [Candidatus Tharpella sp.]